MRPPRRSNKDYERVLIGEMIPGIIEIVQYDNEHKFKGFSGGEDTIQPAVRFKFKLDGYQFPHYSRWMKFNLGEKANLYKKYIAKLVENASPDMDFDLDVLNGLKIKTVWGEENDYQGIDAIYPVDKKIKVELLSPGKETIPDKVDEEEHTPEEDAPPLDTTQAPF